MANALALFGAIKDWVMACNWVLGLVIAVVAAAYLVRLLHRARKASAAPEPIDLPLWDEDRRVPLELTSSDPEEDTAPAVLSPAEWKRPDSANSR